MSRALSLRLDLERVVRRLPIVVLVGDNSERRGGRRVTAANVIIRIKKFACRVAGAWGRNIKVQPVDQNVRASGPRITSRQNDISWDLALQVQVHLLDSTLLEVQVLGIYGAGERADRRRCRIGSNYTRTKALQKNALRAAVDRGVVEGTPPGPVEVVRFCKVRWILPQSLPTLVPRRIVEYRISATNHGRLASEYLPGKTEARFDCGLVYLDSDIWTGGDTERACRSQWAIAGDVHLASGKVEVRLAILGFRNGGRKGPCESKIQGQVTGYAPIILHIGTIQLPATTGGGAGERLIMNAQA